MILGSVLMPIGMFWFTCELLIPVTLGEHVLNRASPTRDVQSKHNMGTAGGIRGLYQLGNPPDIFTGRRMLSLK